MKTTRRTLLTMLGLGAAAAMVPTTHAEAGRSDAIAQARADGYNAGYEQSVLRAESRAEVPNDTAYIFDLIERGEMIPPGTHYVDFPIIINRNGMDIQGAGLELTILRARQPVTDGEFIKIVNGPHWTLAIRGITFDGAGADRWVLWG